MQHSAAYCNILQHTWTHETVDGVVPHMETLASIQQRLHPYRKGPLATWFNTLSHTPPRCNTLQHMREPVPTVYRLPWYLLSLHWSVSGCISKPVPSVRIRTNTQCVRWCVCVCVCVCVRLRISNEITSHYLVRACGCVCMCVRVCTCQKALPAITSAVPMM